MIFFAIRTEPVSKPINGERAFFCGCELQVRQMNRAFRQQHLRQLLDHHRVHGTAGRWSRGSGRAVRRLALITDDKGRAGRHGWGSKTASVCTCPQMNMSSVARLICLPLPRTLARTAAIIFLSKVDLRERPGLGRCSGVRSPWSSLQRRRWCACRARSAPRALRVADLDLARQFFAVDRLTEDRHRPPIRCGPRPRNRRRVPRMNWSA